MFKRILVPVDDSEGSRLALSLAGNMSRAFAAKVRLLHWLDVQAYPNAFGYGNPVIQSAQKYAEASLRDEKFRMEAQGIDVETHLFLAQGERLGECVRADARSWKADAIVLGSHGRKGIGRALLGSGAEQIIRDAPVPALIVRGPASEAIFQRIVVAFDGSLTSMRAHEVAVSLALRFHAAIRIVHSIGSLAVFGAYGYADAFLRQVRVDADRMLKEAAALARAAGIEVDTFVSADDEGLGEFVARQAHSWNADLVVVGTHGRRGVRRAMLGSGAEQIMRHSSTCVLVVTAADAAAAA